MPRFRTGHRVALNVYDGDRPIFQAHSIESAAELVALLNVGHRAGTITTDEIAQVLFASDAMPVAGIERAREAADGMAAELMHRLIRPPDTPPSAPESGSDPPAGTGQPADDSGQRSGRWTLDGTTIWWEFGAGEAMEPEQALRNHVDNPQFEPAYDALAALINGDW